MTTVWTELVEDARYAPSPHNIQPWRVHPRSDREADLEVPVERLLPVGDPEGRFLTATVGIFLEALDVAAAARGLALRYEPLYPQLGAHAAELSLAARMRLEPRGDEQAPAVGLLQRRRTARGRYDGRPAPETVLAELSGIAASFGHDARFTSDPGLVDWIVALNADTLFDDLSNDDSRAEVAGWTHFTNREAERAGDGFSPTCLGFAGLLLRLLFRYHRLCEPAPVRALLRRLYLRGTGGAATVGWIAGPWSTPAEQLDAGRMLMRLWLALTAHGLYLHPFGSVITNPASHARLAERLGADEEHGEIWLLLRVGYCSEPPRSARRPAAEVVA
jgi:nitroreductase